MSNALPVFKYHPDPLKTGSVERSQTACTCCGMVRGYIYVGPVYALDDYLDRICPWCIADGSAARKFDAEFVDSYPLSSVGLAKSIIDAVIHRTPGYVTWQADDWLSHCGDACAFLGHAAVSDVIEASAETIDDWCTRNKQDRSVWAMSSEGYQPHGQPSFHKFQCLHCGFVMLGWDFH